MKKRIYLLAFVMLFSVMLCGCGQEEVLEYTEDGRTIITIGYLPITHALAVFEEKELLDADPTANISIRLQKFSSWTDLMDALDAGKINGASVLAELAMGAASQGIDLKAVALGHRDGNIVIVSNDIHSVEDLRGKTFAIPSNQSSHNILLQDMLALENMGFRDINAIQLPPAEMPVSLASGSIDGYCVAEPFGTQAVCQGFGHVLYTSNDLWQDSICCLIVFNGKYATNHADFVDAFCNGYHQATIDFTREEQFRIATNYLGQSEEILSQSLDWISFDNLDITKESYEVLQQKVIDYHINACPPSYEQFVYPNY